MVKNKNIPGAFAILLDDLQYSCIALHKHLITINLEIPCPRNFIL